jgi:hypothetical protein
MTKLLHQQLMGFPDLFGIKRLLSRIFGKKIVTRRSPEALEQQRFEEDVRSQFLQLKKKGLSIPVFTL